MYSKRRLVVASAITVVVTAGFLPGSGLGSSAAVVRGAQGSPAGLADAIRARLRAETISSSWAVRSMEGPRFGDSVALSADGKTALVAAPFVGNGKGAAYVFHVSDAGSWASSETPIAVLTNKPGPAKDQFFGLGIALSADGTTAFVGAPMAGGGVSGAISVFHVSAEDAWASSSTPTATLTVSDGLSVGASLAVSDDGTTLVAGAPYYNNFAGGAYVFHVSSESAWASTSTPTATLSNAAENQNDIAVGDAVAISGDGTTALLSDSLNPSGGGAYVYHVSAEDAWTTSSTPTAILSDANSASSDFLGSGLALSGDGTVALLGAPGVNAGRGAVDVFRTSGAAAWASTSAPTATLTKAGGSQEDGLGWRVGMSADGTTALVTAPGLDAQRGGAYIFRVADEGAWASSSAPTATLTDSGGRARDSLGWGPALSADGATALVGVPGVRFETGAVDVFHVSDACSWASSSTPTAILNVSALNQCVVPRLKGRTVLAAKSALRARRCRLGSVRRVRSSKPTGRVVFQSRAPRSRWAVGARVAVKIAK